MYTGSDNGLAEIYMMPGTGANPQLTLPQPPEWVDYNANEVAPEAIYDQGQYYPSANYYGYFCTGLGPQSEWGDHNKFFGLDGQEFHYSALQTESSPYVYYPSSYGYAQPSYNPYNPYIPGAVIGFDSPTIGTQQYFTDPSYQLPVSSPTAYIPVIVQPHADAVPNISVAPSVFGTASPIPNRQTSAGLKYSQSRGSSNRGVTSHGTATRTPKSESSQFASSATSVNLPSNKPSSSLGSVTSGNVTQMTQGRTCSMQVTDHFSHGGVSSIQTQSKVPTGNLFPSYGSGVRGWTNVDRFRPRFQFTGAANNGNGNPDILGEQNRGPRTNRTKGQWVSAISDGVQMSKAGANNTQEAIVIRADQYNKDDFLVDYPDAKFFVIKSYSEDDVYKSIKYNVWSSTPNGNKRLDSAYEDAQRISAGKLGNCPIFLFFSVNASGQFCGVAEMIGPVDFDKDMDFWQQDKWTGSFPVKWYIIKDVPNTSVRHILLENNENKPVTNSRDTQEITYIPGTNMLKIFKESPLKTLILDDFMFYEERQKIMQEEKSRFTGRSYSTYRPAIVSANKPTDSAEQNNSADQIAKEDGGQSSVTSDKPSKSDGEQSFDNLLTTEAAPADLKHQKSSDNDGPIDQQVSSKPDAIKPSEDQKDATPVQKEDANVASSVIMMKLLAIGSKEDSEFAVIEKGTESDVVPVGSMHIMVNGTVEATSNAITVGYIPVEPEALKLENNVTASEGN